MMAYKVVKYFIDLRDGNHAYNVGDEFPRVGVMVTDKRIAELAGSNNKQGVPLIAIDREPAEVADVAEVAEEKAAPKKRGRKKSTEE